MITYQQVYQSERIVGIARVDSNNPDEFWVSYTDYELNNRVGKPMIFNMPYSRKCINPWLWEKIIKEIV